MARDTTLTVLRPDDGCKPSNQATALFWQKRQSLYFNVGKLTNTRFHQQMSLNQLIIKYQLQWKRFSSRPESHSQQNNLTFGLQHTTPSYIVSQNAKSMENCEIPPKRQCLPTIKKGLYPPYGLLFYPTPAIMQTDIKLFYFILFWKNDLLLAYMK